MKFSSKPYCSYFLVFLLSACGVKGPLFLPPPNPIPSKPVLAEPIGKLYPLEQTSTDNKNPNSTSVPSDKVTTVAPTNNQ
jgi:predicted small lipoprotein YifL